MAVFALDIGKILEVCRQCCPVTYDEVRRENPIQTLGNVVEPAIDRIRVCIVANRMTGDAIFAVVVAL